ncbi:hypothetical protein K457DRAFT_802423 [Linnemannia elongata AG-77]|uniref:Uncharacterized protein n=1 Tax=Linnemannia elongata AG-77 TaxID=1314771 RepID=A0A197JIM1_9FUNG|nr:hypothetical protein K457DRAFT_802423 [Linnemannia elongata AG-77]
MTHYIASCHELHTTSINLPCQHFQRRVQIDYHRPISAPAPAPVPALFLSLAPPLFSTSP